MTKQEKRRSKAILSSLVAVLAVAVNMSQTVLANEPPKLVVCINVDQLRTDHLLNFRALYGDQGFRRLLSNGIVYPSVDFNLNPINESSAITSIYTGTYPSTHGITSDKIYDKDSHQYKSVLFDKSYLGNYTSERYSPKSLLVSTIGDQLKDASSGLASVYSIAPDAEAAMLSAGSEADGAFWIDNTRGKWATSTYYSKPIPWFVDKLNNNPSESLSGRIGSIVWKPLKKINDKLSPYARTQSQFSYRIGGNVDRYKKTPLINEEVTRLAKDFVEYNGYEVSNRPNLLLITYSAAPSSIAADDGSGAELQDTYVRLDEQVGQLLNSIDHKVGINNCVVMLCGTGYVREKAPNSISLNGTKKRRVFSPERCRALLNMYLMAVYGQGNWVTSYRDGLITLNRKLIEDKKLDIAEVQRKAASFVSEMSGVDECIPTYLFQGEGKVDFADNLLAHSLHSSTQADLAITILPGWHIEEAGNDNRTEYNQSRWYNAPCESPLIFYGGNIKSNKEFNARTSVLNIAPTLGYIFRIRPPCNRGKILNEILQQQTQVTQIRK